MPSFLPRVPEMNPRTEWACQPVAPISSARVAPLTRSRSRIISAFLLPSRPLWGFAFEVVDIADLPHAADGEKLAVRREG